MIDKRLFDLPGMKKYAVILGILVFIQAIAIIAQARALSIAIVYLWNLQSINTILWPTVVFTVAFLGRYLLTVAEHHLLFPFV